jgi:hypothetical protein
MADTTPSKQVVAGSSPAGVASAGAISCSPLAGGRWPKAQYIACSWAIAKPKWSQPGKRGKS